METHSVTGMNLVTGSEAAHGCAVHTFHVGVWTGDGGRRGVGCSVTCMGREVKLCSGALIVGAALWPGRRDGTAVGSSVSGSTGIGRAVKLCSGARLVGAALRPGRSDGGVVGVRPGRAVRSERALGRPVGCFDCVGREVVLCAGEERVGAAVRRDGRRDPFAGLRVGTAMGTREGVCEVGSSPGCALGRALGCSLGCPLGFPLG
jgi:hypothetical protein